MTRVTPRRTRPALDFGRKVQRLLHDRKSSNATPASPTDLAREVPIDPGEVMDWINKGASPRSKTGRRVAELLGVDPGWLLDDAATYPPPPRSESLDVLLRLIPAEQRGRLYEILRDPVERAASIDSPPNPRHRASVSAAAGGGRC